MVLYKTVYEYAEAEYVIERSRFIAHVQPVESYEEAQAFVAKVKQEHKDATHNVPAIVCGNKQEVKWASDDGEPQGTSGLPVLKMISDLGITNVAIVITRYFGGIKLGTGGLARAYTQAAKLAIEKSGISTVEKGCYVSYEMDYSYLAKLQNIEKQGDFSIVDTSFTDKVIVKLAMKEENQEIVAKTLKDLTSGQVTLINSENSLFRTKI